MGEPELYTLQLDVTVNGELSDSDGFAFGIREVTSTLTERGHARFEVNGKPLLVRGAGWAPDLLLRRDPARDFAQLQYVKDMNLNCVRFEGMLERARVPRVVRSRRASSSSRAGAAATAGRNGTSGASRTTSWPRSRCVARSAACAVTRRC